jgi:hypothetical protein
LASKFEKSANLTQSKRLSETEEFDADFEFVGKVYKKNAHKKVMSKLI